MPSKSREGEKSRILLEEVERLRKVEGGLIGENAELRGDRDQLREEIGDLKKKFSEDAARLRRLQESYRELMDEKVALAEQVGVSD